MLDIMFVVQIDVMSTVSVVSVLASTRCIVMIFVLMVFMMLLFMIVLLTVSVNVMRDFMATHCVSTRCVLDGGWVVVNDGSVSSAVFGRALRVVNLCFVSIWGAMDGAAQAWHCCTMGAHFIVLK